MKIEKLNCSAIDSEKACSQKRALNQKNPNETIISKVYEKTVANQPNTKVPPASLSREVKKSATSYTENSIERSENNSGNGSAEIDAKPVKDVLVGSPEKTIDPDVPTQKGVFTWKTVALLTSLIAVASIFLGCKLLLKESPLLEPVPNSEDPDPAFTHRCKAMRNLWDGFKSSVIDCQNAEDLRSIMNINSAQEPGYICFKDCRSVLKRSFTSFCNFDISELESEVKNASVKIPITWEDISELAINGTKVEKDYFIEFYFSEMFESIRNPNCEDAANCWDLDKKQLEEHPWEIETIDALNSNRWATPSFKESQEYLRLRVDDSRPASLFFSTPHTTKGIPLSPNAYLEDLGNHKGLLTLNKETDLKCKSVRSYKVICDEIHSASKLKEGIAYLYIQANKNILLRDAERHGSFVSNWNEPFSECYTDSYDLEKAKPIWED